MTISVIKQSVENAPATPEGLQQAFRTGPNDADAPAQDIDTIVVDTHIDGVFTFWGFSYLDNRQSLAILKCDASNNVVSQTEWKGTRYLWEITLNEAEREATFHGQYSSAATNAWTAL